MLTLIKKLMTNILNLKLVILLEYQNIKIFVQKFILQICQKKFLWLKKLKILWCRHMLLMILMEKKLSEPFMKKELQETNEKSLELKK